TTAAQRDIHATRQLTFGPSWKTIASIRLLPIVMQASGPARGKTGVSSLAGLIGFGGFAGFDFDDVAGNKGLLGFAFRIRILREGVAHEDQVAEGAGVLTLETGLVVVEGSEF